MTGNFIKTCFIPFNSLQDVAGVKFLALTVNASINGTNVMVETTVVMVAMKEVAQVNGGYNAYN